MSLEASVCVLAFNRPQWLQDTVDSLSHNTRHPFGFIVNDDGSSDVTIPPILDYFRENGATIIQNPPGWNEGVGRSINKCFKIATGDILIKLDSDLEFEPEWLEKTTKLFEENPRLGLLGLCHYHHDPVDYHKTLIEHHDDHTIHTHILGSAFAVRREVYEQFGIASYSESFGEDWELMNKIHADPYWYNGLPLESLAVNYGMGLGRSTVALEGPDGEPVTAKIKTSTYKVNGENERYLRIL